MNGKVTVVLGDDSDDEIVTVYSVNDEGVVVIDDDCTTKPATEDPIVRKNTRLSCSNDKNNLPSTSNEKKSTSQAYSSDRQVNSTKQVENPDIIMVASQSTCKTNQTSISNKERIPLSDNFPRSNSSSDTNKNIKPSVSSLNDQNKILSTSRRNPCLPTNNQCSHPPSSSVNIQGSFESTTKRNISKDENFTVTFENNLSDRRKANSHSPNMPEKKSCSSRAPNKDGRSSHERGRTKSTPSNMSDKGTFDSSSLEAQSGFFDKNNTNSHSTNNCSTEVENTQNSKIKRRNRKNSSTNEKINVQHDISHKKPHTQSASASTSTLPQKKRILPADTFGFKCLNSSSNTNKNINPATSSLDDQKKFPLKSKNRMNPLLSTDNQSSHPPPPSLMDSQGGFEPTAKQHVSKDQNFTVTVENNSLDKRKVNFHSPNIQARDSCSSRASNKSGHSSHERGRTQSAPGSMSDKGTCGSSSLGVHQRTGQKRKLNSSERNSCTTNKRNNVTQPQVPHKKQRTQSAPPSTSTVAQTSVASGSQSRQIFSNLQNLPTDSLENLSTFSHILFIDLDNWGKFFSLPYPLPAKVFVWGFCGGNYSNKPRKGSVHFNTLLQEKRFFQHPKCGTSKNAADFALCVQAARLDLQLPKHIPFTVLSGDKGFGELKTQLRSSARQIHLVDPHHEEQDILYATLASIGQT